MEHASKCEQVAKELGERAAAAELTFQQEIGRLEEECRRLQHELDIAIQVKSDLSQRGRSPSRRSDTGSCGRHNRLWRCET